MVVIVCPKGEDSPESVSPSMLPSGATGGGDFTTGAGEDFSKVVVLGEGEAFETRVFTITERSGFFS